VKIAVRMRLDGLIEPNSDKGLEWVKAQKPGAMATFETPKDLRTDAQRKYQWGWTYKMAVKLLNDAGYSILGNMWTKDLFHAAMQECFLIKEELWCREINQYIKVYYSTADMGKKAFSAYMQNIKEFCFNNYDISIPDPNEGYWLDVYRELER
jgi:hypothetical protein